MDYCIQKNIQNIQDAKGSSIGAMVTQYFDINFFADWNALSPHNDVQNKVIQTIGLGARFSYRFKEK